MKITYWSDYACPYCYNDQYPGGNGRQLISSIRQCILTLPDETRLLSGHSDETTVKAEKHLYV